VKTTSCVIHAQSFGAVAEAPRDSRSGLQGFRQSSRPERREPSVHGDLEKAVPDCPRECRLRRGERCLTRAAGVGEVPEDLAAALEGEEAASEAFTGVES
jgi:hypothetical protein